MATTAIAVVGYFYTLSLYSLIYLHQVNLLSLAVYRSCILIGSKAGSNDRDSGRRHPLSPLPNLGESGRTLVGVYIRQAPFAKNTIFGIKFEVLLGYPQQ